MQSAYYVFLALELADRRPADANAYHLAERATWGEPRPSRIRRTVARIALAVARAADAEVLGAAAAAQ
jgi:hypothetical protein